MSSILSTVLSIQRNANCCPFGSRRLRRQQRPEERGLPRLPRPEDQVDIRSRQLLAQNLCIPTVKHTLLYIQTRNLKSTSDVVCPQISQKDTDSASCCHLRKSAPSADHFPSAFCFSARIRCRSLSRCASNNRSLWRSLSSHRITAGTTWSSRLDSLARSSHWMIASRMIMLQCKSLASAPRFSNSVAATFGFLDSF